ncbi:F7 [Felid gammaherpesvirus 1]|uniref:F7 n=1 Tax=Felid gammaherpesvirus 1 TaxID=2560468 RepID=A0A0M4MD83_9GAMA|nr:F7 [Felis catus gammaherpesvirus 1]ALE14713.1 F7 [Felis catus gammaherpesvirus 1]
MWAYGFLILYLMEPTGLLEIYDALDENEIQWCRYLCTGIVPIIDHCPDLKEVLYHLACVYGQRFISELLYSIMRYDLLHKCYGFKVRGYAKHLEALYWVCHIPRHRVVFFWLEQNLNDDELRKLFFFYSNVINRKVYRMLDFVTTLEKEDSLENALQILLEGLKCIGRRDIVRSLQNVNILT